MRRRCAAFALPAGCAPLAATPRGLLARSRARLLRKRITLGPHLVWPQHMCTRSVRERIRPHLDVYSARLGALAAFLEPRRAVAVRAPQAAALPADVWVIDAPVQTLGEEAQRVRDAQHDHLPILERGEAVIEVGGRDRNVLAKSHRVVVVHPGVVARLGAPVLEPLEGRSWVLVGGKAFGTVVAGRARPVERTLALAPVEADERAV